MRHVSIAIVVWLLAVSSSAATFHADTDALFYSAVPGTVVTVTVTLTTVAESLGPFRSFGLRVGWDPTVVKVLGSNPPSTFGESVQSQNVPGLSGSLDPNCASAGPTAGKACTVITQSNVSSSPLAVAPGIVVIGTLLLEVLVGALPGSHLGLFVQAYENNGLTNPAADPNLTLTSRFLNASLVPEPATAALLALGLVGFGVAGRRRAPRKAITR